MASKCIYHLVEEDRWRKAGGEGYLPPTYEADGFIHACHLALHLLPVANYFYTGQGSGWLCCLFMHEGVLASPACSVVERYHRTTELQYE